MAKKSLIKFKKNTEQVELVKAMGSKKRAESLEAMEIFAAEIGKVIGEVIDQADVTSMLYTTLELSDSDTPEIPVDPNNGDLAGEMKIWQQNIAGGLGTNLIAGGETVPFTYYSLYSAISWLKRLLRAGRLDYVAKGINRLAQEILVQQNLNRIVPILASVATATSNNLSHVITATTTNLFQLDDINNLIVRLKLLNAAWTGGTGVNSAGNLSDLFISPGIMAQIRGFTYNPVNTRGVPNSDESTALPMDDFSRAKLMNGGGLPVLFNATLHELNELGLGAAWNVLFDAQYSGSFDPANDEVVLGFDMSQENYIRPVVTEEGSGSVQTFADDQFVARQEKAGLYGHVQEGAVVTDARASVALIV